VILLLTTDSSLLTKFRIIPNVQVSDTTGDTTSTLAGIKKNKNFFISFFKIELTQTHEFMFQFFLLNFSFQHLLKITKEKE